MNEKTAWSFDALTINQRSILYEICNADDGVAYLETEFVAANREAFESLVKIGLITMDSHIDDGDAVIGVAMTPEGDAWLLSLGGDSPP